MRVIQRLMGVENPITDLKVYEHTLHFRNGVAVVESLTEREINRLRTFGFRVERDATSKKAAAKVPAGPQPAAATASAREPVPETAAEAQSVPPQTEAAPVAEPASAPSPAKPKRPASKKEA
ncbi:hypothetical protein [Sulfobacillus harzensis]|uniref:Uncharacterized protein n=1 Tax=Sulfobacillus harzensis TaxID=2729629 RepID=A0A7Y0Q095_9FIRM|nr:hypothetical protein [Sulfobacillus harzensis]NMP20763.1 hypothetical protein [Sulfobacillus harzensis]